MSTPDKKDWKFENLPDRWKMAILGIVLLLLLSATFGMGYAFGRQDSPAPIIIEKIERSEVE